MMTTENIIGKIKSALGKTEISVADMPFFISADEDVLNLNNICILPGFVDVHVHLREPGFSRKETIKTGTMAAANGGYTAVCAMPNLSPCPDTVENIKLQLEIIERDAVIPVYPYACITYKEAGKELVDFESLNEYAIAFSDDGKGVQSDDMMREAMLKAKACGKMIVAHCEDENLLHGGYIHDGDYAREHGHRGICSASEYAQVARDIELVRETGCAYHVCHISTAETVDIIRKAKADGLDVTCETAPHYLVFDDSMLEEDGRFKMNPPIRSKRDRQALIEGIVDGTIDMIATDHAPHTAEEKSRGLEKSAMGVVGLEIAFSALYTHLVKTGIISLEKLVELMSINPRERFNISGGYENEDYTVFNLDSKYIVDENEFLSMGRATPFSKMELYGQCLMTVKGGKVVCLKNLIER